MRKYLFFTAIIMTFFLSSCTKPESADVSFIHAIGFDENDKGITVSAIVENTGNTKSQENNNEIVGSDSKETQTEQAQYTVFSGIGKFPEDAVKSLISQLDNYRFGTSENYYFSEGLSRTSLCEIAQFIPSRPTFPIKCGAVCVSGSSVKKLFTQIKDEEELNNLTQLCDKGKINLITFFGSISDSSKTAVIPTVTFVQSAKRINDTVYRSFAPLKKLTENKNEQQ